MINTTVGMMHPTLIGLPDRTRIEMIELLNSRLAESIDLYLQARHASWNVRGPQFIPLHDLFGRLRRDLEHYGDLLAERVVQLGGMAQGTVRAIQQNSSLPVYPPAIEGSEHVVVIATALAAYAAIMRRSIALTTEIGDPVTADIMTEVSRGVDKWLWLVDANSART
jgi:starvation-inducible DNA-binding protein